MIRQGTHTMCKAFHQSYSNTRSEVLNGSILNLTFEPDVRAVCTREESFIILLQRSYTGRQKAGIKLHPIL